MKYKAVRSLQEILASNKGSMIKSLTRQQSDNDTLLSRLRALLPPRFAQHLVAATYREDSLIMVADSSAWANKIRFEKENILAQLQNTMGSSPTENNNSIGTTTNIKKIIVRTAASKIG